MVYIEEYIEANRFVGFEIGKALDLTKYIEGVDYNTIGDRGMAFNFFKDNITVEVTLKDNLVDSFDVLLHHQENELSLGTANGQTFLLSRANLNNLRAFLGRQNANWTVLLNNEDSMLSFLYKDKLRVAFIFDNDSNGELVLIFLSGI